MRPQERHNSELTYIHTYIKCQNYVHYRYFSVNFNQTETTISVRQCIYIQIQEFQCTVFIVHKSQFNGKVNFYF